MRIESETNDRTASLTDIYNFKYNISTDSYSISVIGTYNPDSSQPYKLDIPFEWPNDAATYQISSQCTPTVHSSRKLSSSVMLEKELGLALASLLQCFHLYSSE